MNRSPTAAILSAWDTVVHSIADSQAGELVGQSKETLIFRRLRQEIERAEPELRIVGPDLQKRFRTWSIDLVCSGGEETIAVEGKFKIQSDGAIPDNRKAAFFDLYKLETYVDHGDYSKGLFLWLTDEQSYLNVAGGDPKDFSTHDRRIYAAGSALHARRSRNPMPLPLILSRSYTFDWRTVDGASRWYDLVLEVAKKPG